MSYLLECLEELDRRFRNQGSKLHIFKGKPIEIFEELHKNHGISRLCFEQDCEPIWRKRDTVVKNWCQAYQIECIEKVGHTLWNPFEIIQLNGGLPPVTFAMFNHVVSTIGLPPRPLPDVDLASVTVANLNSVAYLLPEFPTCQDLGIQKVNGREYQRYVVQEFSCIIER